MLPYLFLLSKTILIIIFGLALINKFLDISRFEEAIRKFEIVPSQYIKLSAIFILIVEALTILLLVSGQNLWGFNLAISTLFVFSIILVSVLRRGLQISCNCFGASEKSVSIYDIVRNFSLIILSLIGILTSLYLKSPPSINLIERILFGVVALIIVLIFVNLQDLVRVIRSV